MRKLFTVIILSIACTAAMAQTKDSLWDDDLKFGFGDSKWDLGVNLGFTYDYSFNAPTGLSNSGFGIDLELLQMKWKGWNNGALTLGILDIIMDWQFLEKGYKFLDNASGETLPALDGKGSRMNCTFGFPVGVTQQFSDKFGVSFEAVPGIGIHTFFNEYDGLGAHHDDRFYPTKGRVAFDLHLKATVWYDDFGVVFRYQPLQYKDVNTTMLSVGVVIRN